MDEVDPAATTSLADAVRMSARMTDLTRFAATTDRIQAQHSAALASAAATSTLANMARMSARMTDLTRFAATTDRFQAQHSAALASAAMTSTLADAVRMSATLTPANLGNITRIAAASDRFQVQTAAALASAASTSTLADTRLLDARGFWDLTRGLTEVDGSRVIPAVVGGPRFRPSDRQLLMWLLEASMTLKGLEIYIEHEWAFNYVLGFITLATIVHGPFKWTNSRLG